MSSQDARLHMPIVADLILEDNPAGLVLQPRDLLSWLADEKRFRRVARKLQGQNTGEHLNVG